VLGNSPGLKLWLHERADIRLTRQVRLYQKVAAAHRASTAEILATGEAPEERLDSPREDGMDSHPPAENLPDGAIDRGSLADRFVRRSGEALSRARATSGYSSTDLAHRSGVPSTHVERAEEGHTQDMTLRQYLDLALACDHLPLDLVLVPSEELARFAREAPPVPRTALEYEAWRSRRSLREALASARRAR